MYDFNGNEITSYFDYNGNEASILSDFSLKIMSYNVGGFYTGIGTNVPQAEYDAYRGLLEQTMEDNDPDVVGFQEYRGDFSGGILTSEILKEYTPYTKSIDGNASFTGKGISTKEKQTNVESVLFTNQTGTQKKFLVSHITMHGKTITLISAHLDWQVKSVAYSQVADLVDYCKNQQYFILMGDFNTDYLVKDDETCEENVNILKPFEDEGFNMANDVYKFIVTYWGTTTDNGSGVPLDYIITSSNIDIDSSYSYDLKLRDDIVAKIDHIPLVAECTVHL